MRTTRWIAMVLLLVAAAAVPTVSVASGVADRFQQEGPGRGDDLGRVKAWRTFLDRADRAFFAARMNAEAVQAKIAKADERIEELEAAPKDDPGGRSDITGDVAFLERADRAFTAAHMNTADVKKWLREAREKTGQEVRTLPDERRAYVEVIAAERRSAERALRDDHRSPVGGSVRYRIRAVAGPLFAETAEVQEVTELVLEKGGPRLRLGRNIVYYDEIGT